MKSNLPRALGALFVTLALGACGGSSPTGSGPTGPGPVAQTVALAGTIYGVGSGSIPITLTCSTGTRAERGFSGTISGLGATTVSSAYCLNLTGFDAVSSTLSMEGPGIFAAANGDRLMFAFTGTNVQTGACDSPYTVELYGTLSSGTGQFVGANGFVRISGTMVPPNCPSTHVPAPNTTTATVTGTITLKS